MQASPGTLNCGKWLVTALMLLPFRGAAQDYRIDWFKIAAGGGLATDSTYQVSSTLGQQDAGGPLTGGAYSLTGGFWTLVGAVQTPGFPLLSIRSPAPGTLVISWPASSTGFLLQLNGNLKTTNWLGVTNLPSVVFGQNQVLISPAPGNQFYRLIYPVPPLSIQFTGPSTVLLSWPAPSTRFMLQQNSSLDAPNWFNVTNVPTVVNGTNEVTLSPVTGNEFYRLVYQ